MTEREKTRENDGEKEKARGNDGKRENEGK